MLIERLKTEWKRFKMFDRANELMMIRLIFFNNIDIRVVQQLGMEQFFFIFLFKYKIFLYVITLLF